MPWLGTVKEGQFHRLMQQSEQGFLLRFFAAERLDSMAAKRAQLQDFAAPPPQAVNAFVAQHLPAMEALMGHPRFGMARAQERAVSEHDRRRRTRNFKLRNGNVNLRGLDEDFDITHGEGLSGSEGCFLNHFAGYEGAIGRIAIADDEVAVGQPDLAMSCGDGGMLDLKIVFGAAAQAIYSQFEFNHLVSKAFRFDD